MTFLGHNEQAMTPLGKCLRSIREARHLRQQQVAALLGVDQSYVSVLENGGKASISDELLGRIRANLQLSTDEARRLDEAVRLSRRKFILPSNASPAEFEIYDLLMKEAGNLNIHQIQAIKSILRLTRTEHGSCKGDSIM